MRYYPVCLDINLKPVLVVGGGDVGTRKVLMLVECGAHVTLVSPDATKKLVQLATSGRIEWKRRTYRVSDLTGIFLVIGTTNNEQVNQQISTQAQQLNLLCNIADKPKACNFILPSILRRGDLLISISTSGTSPAFAKQLRKEFEKQFGNEYADFLKLMGAIRRKLLAQTHEPETHKPLFESLLQNDLMNRIKTGDKHAINTLLVNTFGNGFEYETLMETKQQTSSRGNIDDNP